MNSNSLLVSSLSVGSNFTYLLLDYLDFGEARLIGLIADQLYWLRRRVESCIERGERVPSIKDVQSTDDEETWKDIYDVDVEVEQSDLEEPHLVFGEEEFYRYMITRLLGKYPKRKNHLLGQRLATISRRNSDGGIIHDKDYSQDTTLRESFYSPQIFDAYCHNCYSALNEIRMTQILDGLVANERVNIEVAMTERTVLLEALRMQNIVDSSDNTTDQSHALPPQLEEHMRTSNNRKGSIFPTCANCEYEYRGNDDSFTNTKSIEDLELPDLGELKDDPSKLYWSKETETEPIVAEDQEGFPEPAAMNVSSRSYSRVMVFDRLYVPLQLFYGIYSRDRSFVMTLALPFIIENDIVQQSQIEDINKVIIWKSDADTLIQSLLHESKDCNDDVLRNPLSISFKPHLRHGGLAIDPCRFIVNAHVYQTCRRIVHKWFHCNLSRIISSYIGSSFLLYDVSQLLYKAIKNQSYDVHTDGNKLMTSVALYLSHDIDIIRTGCGPLPPSKLISAEELKCLLQERVDNHYVPLTMEDLKTPISRPLPIYEVFKAVRRVVDTIVRYKRISQARSWPSLEIRIEAYLKCFKVIDRIGLCRDYLSLVEHAMGLDRPIEPFTGEYLDRYIIRRSADEAEESKDQLKEDGSDLNKYKFRKQFDEARRLNYLDDKEDHQMIHELFCYYCQRKPVVVHGDLKDYNKALKKVIKNNFEMEDRRLQLELARRKGLDIQKYL